MGSKDRDKAQDIFNKTDYLFSNKGTFQEVFPQIKKIRFEVIETETFENVEFDNFEKYKERSTYNKETFPGEYFNCTNTLCYKGGFQIAEVVREMVRNRETNSEGCKPCKGYEGSPKGQKKYRDCMHQFFYKVSIKYKNNVANKNS